MKKVLTLCDGLSAENKASVAGLLMANNVTESSVGAFARSLAYQDREDLIGLLQDVPNEE